STPTFVYFVTLKEFFKEKGIEFEEVDVSLNEEAAREMIMKTGQMGVPVVEIGEEVIVGFDRDKINQALGL
ncbi:MAG: NrdH-redoxin, partial [Erysipelotrichia bacterium]|nr:NrdH-redoxin [Erysipelotrichia bacterium]